jgi:hypothetical protein
MSALSLDSASTYASLSRLELMIEGYALEPRSLNLDRAFTRHSTVVHLIGAGQEGVGEDTTYAPTDQLDFQAGRCALALEGRWTVKSFSAHLEDLDLFPTGPSLPEFVSFRRWAFESAALDLALRQASLSLADILRRAPAPVSFVVSPGPEDSIDPTRERLERYPGMRLKLMPTPNWDERLVQELAATGAVDIVDLKGQYDKRVPVALPPEPRLYGWILDAFTDAWIEDPAVTAETESLLAPHWERITWDAPIHSVADIERLPYRPRMLNIKPSRFGSVRALLDAYDYCARCGIGCYGGGQFELGAGRGQIQLLASLFHADAPNDVAPGAYNEPALADGLPDSPLSLPRLQAGFR